MEPSGDTFSRRSTFRTHRNLRTLRWVVSGICIFKGLFGVCSLGFGLPRVGRSGHRNAKGSGSSFASYCSKVKYKLAQESAIPGTIGGWTKTIDGCRLGVIQQHLAFSSRAGLIAAVTQMSCDAAGCRDLLKRSSSFEDSLVEVQARKYSSARTVKYCTEVLNMVI